MVLCRATAQAGSRTLGFEGQYSGWNARATEDGVGTTGQGPQAGLPCFKTSDARLLFTAHCRCAFF